jgi:type IV pilus assembly protein PilB
LTNVKTGLFVVGAPPRHGIRTTLRAVAVECAKEKRLVASLVPMGSKPNDGVIDVRGLEPDAADAELVKIAFRHDPDVLVAGRLEESRQAAEAVMAALSGVRVFASVNAATPAEARAVLRTLGVDDVLLDKSRMTFTSQRLVGALCLLCRESDNAGAGRLRELGFPESGLRAATIYAARTCERCVSGFRGKFAIMENLSGPGVSSKVAGAVSTPPPGSAKGAVSLTESLFRAVARGRTTVSELVRTMEDLGLSHGGSAGTQSNHA